MPLLRNALIGLGLALAIPAMSAAAPPAEDPRDVRIRELSDRVSDLEKALKDLNAQVESAARNADLARGDVKALQDRMTGPQPASPAPVPVAAGPAVAATASGSPAVPSQDGLTLGRQQLQGGDPRTAEATLTTWLASAPGDPKAGEGAYLRGRARSQQSAWADAAADYITALKGWPATWWAPDAVVELARALGRLGKTAESCQALETLTARYPAASEGARTRAAAVSAQSRCGA
jgi:TolA-binding protein